MECNNLEYSRRLPPELLVEMHKCLPLDKAIYVLVNVSSYAFVAINSTRMHRTVERIKTSLNEYMDTLVGEVRANNNRKKLVIRNAIEWKPQMDALLHFGSWLTSTRKLKSFNVDGSGMPQNFVEKFLLHLANSSSTQMMLKVAHLYFPFEPRLPIPTFLKPLFNEKHFWVGNRILFESVELKTDNGQTIYIHDGECNGYKLKLFVMNEINDKDWFKITMNLDSSKEFIQRLKFSQWNIQSLEDVNEFIQKYENPFEEKDGNILEARKKICFNANLGMFLRRGAKFTQFRHLKINQGNDYLYCCPEDYIDFLINFVSNAKHPDEFLESIDFGLVHKCSNSIKNLWEICQKGIPRDGKFVHFNEKKLLILSAKRIWLKVEDSSEYDENKLEFTLANLPTNGEYLFDVCAEFGNGLKEIVGIKIQKRKADGIVELKLKCEDQIEKQQGKKRKASNEDGGEEDGPICSTKIMKK